MAPLGVTLRKTTLDWILRDIRHASPFEQHIVAGTESLILLDRQSDKCNGLFVSKRDRKSQW